MKFSMNGITLLLKTRLATTAISRRFAVLSTARQVA